MESRSPGSTSRTRRALPFRPLPALDCWHFICRTQRSISRGLVHPYHFEKLQDKSTKQPQCLGTSVPPGWTAFPRLSHGNCAHSHACISSLSMPHTSSMDSNQVHPNCFLPFLSSQPKALGRAQACACVTLKSGEFVPAPRGTNLSPMGDKNRSLGPCTFTTRPLA